MWNTEQGIAKSRCASGRLVECRRCDQDVTGLNITPCGYCVPVPTLGSVNEYQRMWSKQAYCLMY